MTWKNICLLVLATLPFFSKSVLCEERATMLLWVFPSPAAANSKSNTEKELITTWSISDSGKLTPYVFCQLMSAKLNQSEARKFHEKLIKKELEALDLWKSLDYFEKDNKYVADSMREAGQKLNKNLRELNEKWYFIDCANASGTEDLKSILAPE